MGILMNWLARLSVQATRGERETFLWLLRLLQKLNPLNLKIKSHNRCPYSFHTEEVGKS